jgi:uncharacterized membrane protein YfhO
MNIKKKAILMAMVSCSLGFGTHCFAGQKLDALNTQVEQKAAEIDQKHGVLLDTSERNELKMDLIIQQVAADTANDTDKTMTVIANTAIATYEITDPTEQRKLLIKLEAQAQAAKSTGHGGTEPDYP